MSRKAKILSDATAYRAIGVCPLKSAALGKRNVYEVHFEGMRLLGVYVAAADLPQARGLVRRALREAFESAWNQSLIFRGELHEGEVSETQFRMALRRVTETSHATPVAQHDTVSRANQT